MKTPYHRPAQLLRALSHPVRLHLLNALCEQEQCVCHLTALAGKRQAYVSQQLAALRRTGLVNMRKEGLRIYYRLNDSRVRAILETLDLSNESSRTARNCKCPKCNCSNDGSGARQTDGIIKQ
jgi:ArsR family transcriptional regulator